jgi:drug/metabolite transporter (DMT)-like permease
MPYLGETLAFLSALVWAIGVVLFKKSGESLHPLALNLYKNILALFLFLPTIALFNTSLFHAASFHYYGLFLISGVIGIGIGDSLFFKSLNKIGAGLSAIVDCLYSPFVIALSMIFLGETLRFIQLIGVLLIISAILLTINVDHGTRITKTELLWGILWGILALLSYAIAIVMIKPALEHVPLLWAIEIRLSGGILAILIMLAFHPIRKGIIKSLFVSKGMRYTILGTLMGTYCSILFWMGGMKYTQASIASALNQTSNIFVFLFAAFFLKEMLSYRHVLAIIVGVAGAFLVIIG